MKKIARLLVIIIVWSAASAHAQTVVGDRFKLNTGPCVVRSGSGAPSGGNVCDHYIDTATGALYEKRVTVGWVALGSGTVTSVGLSMPSQFAVTGSPVTTSGTLAAAWNTQTANYGLFGPTSGGAAVPTFRALGLSDLPVGAANTVMWSNGSAASWTVSPVAQDYKFSGFGSTTGWLGYAAGSSVIGQVNGTQSLVLYADRTRIDAAKGISLGGDIGTYLTSSVAGLAEFNNGTAGQYRDIQIRAMNPTTGHVGLGTQAAGATPPPSPYTSSSGSTLLEVASTNDSRDSGVLLRRLDLARGLDLWQDGSTGYTYIDTRHDSNSTGLIFRTKTAGAGPVEAMTVLGSGYVGIGTTAPSTLLHIDGANPFIRVQNTSTGGYGLYANPADAYIAFSAGSGALITGSVAGDIGLRTANKSMLFSNDAGTTAHLTIGPTGDASFSANVGTSTFASQTTGWRVTAAGALDVRYLYTDELRAKLFTADMESVLAGSQRVTKSYSTISQTFTCPAASATATLWVKDSPTFGDAAVFVSGDSVVIHSMTRTVFGPFTISDCVGVVTVYADGSGANAGQQSWTFTRNAGGNAGTMTAATTVAVDQLVQDLGTTGNGYVETSAVDGAAGINAPYTQVVTWATAPVTANLSTRARFGNLRGITGTTEYGLLAGSYSATNGSYFRASDVAFELHGIALSLWDSGTKVMRLEPNAGSPYLSMGSTPPTSYGSNVGVFLGWSHASTKAQMSLYADANNFLKYDGTNLTWKGANTELDASGNLTATSATLTGSITANTGFIGGTGGWVIGTGLISATNARISSNGTTGYISFGSTPPTAYAATGSWFGYDTAPKLSLVYDANNYFLWNGTALRFKAANTTLDSSGNLTATSATLTGAITATSGSVGSFTIGTYLYTGSKTAYNDGLAGVHVGSDGIGLGSTFSVSAAGALSATSATITGAVTATTGSVGSFTIGTYLNSGSKATYNDGVAGVHVGSDGIGLGSAFTVSAAGALTATSATITGTITANTGYLGGVSGWTIGTGTLTATNVGLSSLVAGGDDVRIWAGSASSATAPFTVTESGYLRASAGTFGTGSNGVDVDGSGLTITGTGRIAWRGGAGYMNASDIISPSYKFTSGFEAYDSSGTFRVNASGRFDSDLTVGYDAYVNHSLIVAADVYMTSFATTTGDNYPVVFDGSILRQKTDGLSGANSCPGGEHYASITFESGIAVDYNCTAFPALAATTSEIEQLRREIAELRAALAELAPRPLGADSLYTRNLKEIRK